MTPPLISVRGVHVSFGEVKALTDLTLDVPTGGLLALVGPSGCGKTTALRVIAGFQDVDAGSVAIRDREVLGPNINIAPEKRNVGMVFQDYALFPHISVEENVGYGVSGSDRVERVAEVLDLVGLNGYESRFPHELSVFADAIEDHDRIVDRITDQGQKRRDQIQSNLEIEDRDESEREHDVVENRNRGTDSVDELEPEALV